MSRAMTMKIAFEKNCAFSSCSVGPVRRKIVSQGKYTLEFQTMFFLPLWWLPLYSLA